MALDLGITREQKRIVAILLFGTFMVVLNQTLLSPAFPAMMVEFGIDAPTVQWLTSGYSLVEAVVVPLSAFFVGKFSTRKLFVGGFCLFTVGTLLAAWAPVFPVLLLGRVLQALCTGVVMPMTFTLILLIFPREKRGSGMGLVSLIIGFAPTIGPTLSGALVDTVGWHMMFVIIACIAAIVLLAGFFGLVNYGDFEEAPFDPLSVVLSSLGLLGILYGFSTFSTSDNLILTGAFIAAGAVLLIIFMRRQGKLEIPMLRVEVLKIRRYTIAVVTAGLMQGGLIACSVIMPIFVQQVLGQSATMSGLVILPGALLGAFMSLASGRLFDRFGMRRVAIPGIVVMLSGTIGFALMGPTVDVLVIMALNLIMSAGMQTVVTPLNTWGFNALPNRVMQHGNAVSNTIGQVFISFCTALVVSVTALSPWVFPQAPAQDRLYLGEHLGFIAIAIIVLLVMLSIVFLARNRASDVSATQEARRESDEQSRTAGIPVMARARDIMRTDPPIIQSTATIGEALALFSEGENSGMPVVDPRGHVVGFVSDGDVMKYIGRNDALLATPLGASYRFTDDDDLVGRLTTLLGLNVMQIATVDSVITAEADMPIDQVCHLLASNRIKKLPVMEGERLVGTLSRHDVINAINAGAPSVPATATAD